jgi:AcrR family transcriptional regulator
MQTQADVKHQIIEVAQARFSRYGFGKTTMAEIAKDCNMSPANLYRYFESKEDIAVEIGNQCLCSKEAVLREVLRSPGLSAGERFEAFVVATLHYVYNLFSEQPHLSEIVETICKPNLDSMKRHKEAYLNLLGHVLEEGNRRGEFDVPDIRATGEMIQNATLKFTYPPIMMQEGLSLEELESQARALSKLIVRGLAKR